MATQVMEGAAADVQKRFQSLHLKPEQFVRVTWEEDTLPSDGILFERIYRDFSAGFWSRVRVLRDKLEAQRLTEEERAEFIRLNDALELQNAERIESLALLGKRRGMTLPQIMQSLQIGSVHIPDEI